MRHFLVSLLAGTVSLALLTAAFAQGTPKTKKLSIVGAVPGTGTSNPEELEVVLSNLPKDFNPDVVEWDVFVVHNDGTAAFFQSSEGSWIVSGTSKSQPPAPPHNLVTKDAKDPSIFYLYLPTGAFSNLGSLTVTLKIPPVTGIVFDGKAYPYTPPQKACSFVLCPAADKASSAIYATGLYSPAFHSQAQYTIDAEGVLTFPVTRKRTLRLGGSFNLATDNRPSADPDSYIVSGLLDWYIRPIPWKRIQYLLLRVSPVEYEFDRQSTTKTIVSSPVIVAPVRLRDKRGLNTSMFPYIGIEGGSNLSNAIASGGSGRVFRGLVGSGFNGTYKTPWKSLSQIGITANYNVRLPSTDEVFTNTHYISATGKTVSLPVYSTQARHHLTDELDITLQKPLALTIKHEYGELPPGFRKVDNKISIGLTVMLSHTGVIGAGDSVTRQKW
jgi:hypothetical protein